MLQEDLLTQWQYVQDLVISKDKKVFQDRTKYYPKPSDDVDFLRIWRKLPGQKTYKFDASGNQIKFQMSPTSSIVRTQSFIRDIKPEVAVRCVSDSSMRRKWDTRLQDHRIIE